MDEIDDELINMDEDDNNDLISIDKDELKELDFDGFDEDELWCEEYEEDN